MIEQMRTTLRLRHDRGEYYPMKMKDPETNTFVSRKTLTATAYARINTLMGVSFSSPTNLIIDQNAVGNPHFDRSGASIHRVTVRRIGLGRNAAGSLVANDLTLTLDLDDYLSSEVFDAWKPWGAGSTTKPWGRIVGSREAINAVKPNEKVIDCPGGIFLIVDLNDPKVIGLWSAHMQRQKFAERNAVSICERNILKRMLGQTYANDKGEVTFVYWSSPDRTRMEIESILDRIKKGEVQIDGEDVVMEKAVETVGAEEAKAVLSGEGEDGPVSADDVPEEEKESIEAVRAEIRKLWAKVSKEQRSQALGENHFLNAGEVSRCKDDVKVQEFRDSLRKFSTVE